NQFAYPLQTDEKRDFRYGMIDLVNILSAETIAFNSGFNRGIFFKECRNLFQRLPDAVPRDALKKAEEKSGIIYPGIDIISIQSQAAVSKSHKIPLIIWNHRHEYDKDPDTTFRVLENLHKKGIPFRLAILGERFSKAPEAITRARHVLSDHIVIDDYPPGDDYYKWLRLGDIVISTALQENFGLSVIEAASAGCWPLLPRRLAYPEVMPAWVAEACFWDTEKQLENKLEKLLITPLSQRTKLTRPLSRWLTRYSWTEQAEKLDSMIISTASGKKHPEKSW
ncbi:MAG: DUF3524 domain-containing protein, partial [Spirochaetaceae bacterium]|nr:DUF3524 domain-containing protein [Spirochaetaceae bacterium]